MKSIWIVLCGVAFLFTRCRKDGKDCWQAFDPQVYGDAPGLVRCNQTKAEAEAAYPQYWFYKSGETKFCWKIQSGTFQTFVWDIPVSMAEKYHVEHPDLQFTKINCSSFCALTWHEKHKSKITGSYGPTSVVTENLASADTCSKLSVGVVVVVRETSDSLITRELLSKRP